MAGGEERSARWLGRLEYGNEREEEGEWKSSSQRIWWRQRRGRGGAGARESSKVRRRPKVGDELREDATGLPRSNGLV
jgi:hypothetical protein